MGIVDQFRREMEALEQEIEEYTDAELYRIMVAQNILEGRVHGKAEMDAIVRSYLDLATSDAIIAAAEQWH